MLSSAKLAEMDQKTKMMIAGGTAGVLLLLVIGWMFMGRGGDETPAPGVGTTAPGISRPAGTMADESAPGGGAVRPAGGGAAAAAADSGDDTGGGTSKAGAKQGGDGF